jgi:LytS/YehU family sensor histidine kinase
MINSRRFWAGIVAINASAAVFANLAFGNFSWQTPPGRFLQASAVTFLFSTCCSTLCFIGLPHVVPFARRWVPFPLNWAVVVVTLIGFASSGSLIALSILYAIGYIPSGAVFMGYFTGTLKIASVVTLLFGLFGTIVETLRKQLDETTLALRTKERDEAEARRMAAEARLASLESRVQPHFLFNTLNSIAALIHENPAAAERMTGQFASLLRSSLDQQTPLVPLDEEMQTVRNYLEIERVRFGDRLRFDITSDRDAADAHIPRLSVQTIVENSVKYAVSPRREGGSIAVRSSSVNGHVRVEVEDDGPGFDAAAIPVGHGLALVKERLASMLGEQASLNIDARPGRTRVAIDIPSSR